MSNYLSEDGTFINSLIGEGSFFKGDISLKGLLRIDGDFKGTISEGGKVLVGKSGRAEAIVSAGTVVIGGVLKGNITATEKVVILSTGMVIGNILAPRLLVEDGVILNGTCTVSEVGGNTESAAFSTVGSSFSTGRINKPFRFSAGKERERESVSSWKE
ncbi:MAG: polymer-forming cytoskeletal protein [Spirochaetales bacterium]|uniref:Polymer-forming cytoskeletal protein n=1 Tax=Candidatus Thalassospirochaeta sargassi TaxID=3119039 RepID=A0AAJ1I9R8_9SPIO|nr:polymer-forming cytoskeletal protein [Spirochaetales bacterium]